MKVVLDTNAICRDFRLQGYAFSRLLHETTHGDIDLVVPELVIREAVRVYTREFAAHKRPLEKSLAAFRRMGLTRRHEGPHVPKTIQEAEIGYEKDLRSILEQAKAELLPTPEVAHDRILDRLFQERPPMSRGQSGYRDTLIWETISAMAVAGSDVAFVTRNWKDFADEHGGGLAEQLLAELAEVGAAGKVTVYPTVEAFVTSHLPAVEEASLRDLGRMVRDPDYDLALTEYLHQVLAEYGLPVELDSWDSDYFDASLSEMKSFGSLDVLDVQAQTGYLIATLQGVGGAVIEAFIEPDSLRVLPTRDQPEVLQSDWEANRVQVRFERTIRATFEAPFLPGDDGGLQDVYSITIQAIGRGGSAASAPQEERLFH